MKKILKLFIFIFICFMPFMVEAETKLVYEWKVNDKEFIATADGEYYFTDYTNIIKYDKKGNLLGNEEFDFEENIKVSSYYEDKLLFGLLNYLEGELKYNNKLDIYYMVNYYREIVTYYGENTNDKSFNLDFSNPEDLEMIKELLGNEYEVYKKVISEHIELDFISIQNGFYIVHGFDNNEDCEFVMLFDKNANLIMEKKSEKYTDSIIHVFDDKIYVIYNNTFFEVYDLELNLLYQINIYNDLDNLYKNMDCYFELEEFYVKDNNLVVQYAYYMPGAIENDLKDFAKVSRPDFFVAKFRLSNDVEHIASDKGVSYSERKVDELDREYVELRIEPKAGYIVDEIIVTDAYGNRIEVNDNKFYMPSTDVKVEVKYKGGEYLPIPNTALSQNISFILIGILLIGLGMYTMNFIKREEN